MSSIVLLPSFLLLNAFVYSFMAVPIKLRPDIKFTLQTNVLVSIEYESSSTLS